MACKTSRRDRLAIATLVIEENIRPKRLQEGTLVFTTEEQAFVETYLPLPQSLDNAFVRGAQSGRSQVPCESDNLFPRRIRVGVRAVHSKQV